MIIFLYGEDSYTSHQKLKEIVAHYQEIHKSGLNLRYFNGEDADFTSIENELRTVSMFKEKKLLVLKNIFSSQGIKDGLSENIKRFAGSDNIILIYENKGGLNKDAFFAFLKKYAQSQEFKKLEGIKLNNWLKKEFMGMKLKISPLASEIMVNCAGDDLWQMSNYVQQLAAFKKSGEITTADVKLFVKPKMETDIFKTIDAIAAKNKKLALKLLHTHLEKGDSPLYLLSMINYQFRNIIGVKDLTDKGKSLSCSGLKPFPARKSCEQSKKFTFEELKKIYLKIFQVDYNIKTGKLDPQTALDLLIAEL